MLVKISLHQLNNYACSFLISYNTCLKNVFHKYTTMVLVVSCFC